MDHLMQTLQRRVRIFLGGSVVILGQVMNAVQCNRVWLRRGDAKDRARPVPD